MTDRKLVSKPGDSKALESSEEVAAIPLVEERLSIAKRQVECGRVRVRVTVEERVETASEELLRDKLEIERVPRMCGSPRSLMCASKAKPRFFPSLRKSWSSKKP